MRINDSCSKPSLNLMPNTISDVGTGIERTINVDCWLHNGLSLCASKEDRRSRWLSGPLGMPAPSFHSTW